MSSPGGEGTRMQVFDLRGGSSWKGSKKVRRDKTEAAKMLPGPVCTLPSWSSEPGVLGRQRRLHGPQGKSCPWDGEDCVLVCLWFRAACQLPPRAREKTVGWKVNMLPQVQKKAQ